ncbi:MAG: hypothetical protein ACNA7M_03695 [Roseovarius sp.]
MTLALIVTVMFGAGLLDQDATAGRLMRAVRRVRKERGALFSR